MACVSRPVDVYMIWAEWYREAYILTCICVFYVCKESRVFGEVRSGAGEELTTTKVLLRYLLNWLIEFPIETAFIYWLAFGKFIKQNIATAKSELGTIRSTYFTKINQFAGFERSSYSHTRDASVGFPLLNFNLKKCCKRKITVAGKLVSWVWLRSAWAPL